MNHEKNIQKLCRVCSKKIKVDKGYINPKEAIIYKDIFLTFFGLDVENENCNVFPKRLCIICKRKFESSIKNNRPPDVLIYQFTEHTNSCPICFNSSKSSKSTGSFWKELETLLAAQKFSKLTNVNHEDKIYYKSILNNDKSVDAECTLRIHPDLTWDLFVFQKLVDIEIGYLADFPKILAKENILSFATMLGDAHICRANSDFCDVIKSRLDYKEPFTSQNNEVAALLEDSSTHGQLSSKSFDTIRHSNCQYIIKPEENQCRPCQAFRKNLHTYRSRLESTKERASRTSDSSRTAFSHLSREELIERLQNTSKAKQVAVTKAAILSSRLSEVMQKEGVHLQDDENHFFKEVFDCTENKFEENSPMWLLWQHQKDRINHSGSGLQWHPLLIRWCISIYLTSPAAYKQISNKNNKFLILPHINTLKKYINYTTPCTGFNIDVIERLIEESKLDVIPDFQKNVSLVYDEMKIQSNLVYNKTTGKLVGFLELGDINDEIKILERKLDGKKSILDNIATYVNVFMVRGICSSLTYTFGYHASQGLTSFQLWPLVWEATRILESIGFKVRAWICDGATPNRRNFKINSVFCHDEVGYYTINQFAPDRKIFFISDVPHLLKTTRNNLENSHGNRNTKKLHVNNQDISWYHIVQVYEWDLGVSTRNIKNDDSYDISTIKPSKLRFLPKIKEEHIRLSPRHRMRVKLAAQVISNSMANALQIQGKFYTKSTEEFLRLFNRAFDCLNVSSWKKDSNADLRVYDSVDDERFEFLQSVLTYLDNWRSKVYRTPGITKEEKLRACLSLATDYGWHLTIKSFVELTKLLLQEDGVKFIMSEKLSQDPLEQHFARHRRVGGSSENPSLQQFERQEISLNVMRSELINDLRGNTQRQEKVSLDASDTRLPSKRPRRK